MEKIDTKKSLDPVVTATIRLLREPEKYGHKITKKYDRFTDYYCSIQFEDNYDDDKLIYQDEKKGLYYVQLDSVKQVRADGCSFQKGRTRRRRYTHSAS